GLAAELEALPGSRHGRPDDPVASEDRLRVLVLGGVDEPPGLGDEPGDLTVLERNEPITFRHDDLAAVGDDVLRGLGVRPAARILTLGDGGKDRSRRSDVSRRNKKVLPLIGHRATEGTRERLDKAHLVFLRELVGAARRWA